MSKRKLMMKIKLPVLVLLVVLFGCSSPLMEIVKAEVEIVTTPPEVVSVYPEVDDVDIAISTNTISATFTKSISSSSVTSSTFYITNPLGEKVSGVLSVSADTITFTPNSSLSVGTTYTVTIDGIKDIDENPISEKYEWTFTTGIDADNVIPVINSVVINMDDTWTSSKTITVDLDASDNFGVAQMNYSFDNFVTESGWITFIDSFSLDLPDGDGDKEVFIKVKDGSGNESSSTSSDMIQLDSTPPVIDNFLIDGGKSATMNTLVSLYITGVDDGTGASGMTDYMYRLSGDSWPASWTTLTEDSVFLSDIALSNSPSTGDMITYEAKVRDLAGNESIIFTADIIYDLTPPIVNIYSPAVNETNTPYDTSVVSLTFNEEMDLSSFTNDTFFISGYGIPGTPDWEIKYYDSEDISNSIIHLDGFTLTPEKDYVVTLKSNIKDVAGNEYGRDEYWSFRTGLATDQTAPTGSVSVASGPTSIVELPTGVYAVNDFTLDLAIVATDDYNSVYSMNFWGEGDLPPFEDPVGGWELFTGTKTWTLGTTQKSYNLWFRLQDSRGNVTQDPPEHFKVIYDDSAPTYTAISIINGLLDPSLNAYISNPEGNTTIQISANDIGVDSYDGSGIKQIRLSNDGVFDGEYDSVPTSDENWREWAPIISDWLVDSASDGTKTIYFEIEDYLGNSASATTTVTVDTEAPVIVFDLDDSDGTTDILEVNSTATQTSTITDNIVVDPNDLTYSWIQEDENTGQLIITGNNTMEPDIEADTDGTYLLKVTVSDYAGNISTDTIPFIWDTIPPEAIGVMTAYDLEGNVITTSSGSLGYTTSTEASMSWPESAGASFYRIIFGSPDDVSPPDWDSWDWDTTFPPNYDETPINSIASGEPSEPGDNDGSYRFYVTAWDKAGNRTNNTTLSTLDLVIDTLPPIITNKGQLISANAELEVDYSVDTVPGGSENALYDQLSPESSPTIPGSGIDESSISWNYVSGPGTLNINDTDPRKPLISAAVEGVYEISVSVSDIAGNSDTAILFYEWDVTPPGAPTVTGINITNDQTPTWSWFSGGGGIGEYEYKLDRYSLSDVFEAEEVSWTTITAEDYTPLSNLTDLRKYRLSLRERDRAGNWSSISTKTIHIDSSFTAEPPPITISGGDDVRTISDSATVQWNWSTGLSSGGGNYRYKLDDPDLTDITATNDTTNTYSVTFSTDGSDDGYHTMYVEEYDSNNTTWWNLVSESTVLIDFTKPAMPTLYGPASVITYSTPYWSWSGEEGSVDFGGIGYFRYSSNGGSTWNYTYDKSVTLSLTDGTYDFALQEQDLAGNWSDSAEQSVLIDTTPPTLNSVSINSNATYTNSTTVTYTIDAVNETGMEMSIYDYNPAGWKDWETFSPSKTIYLPSGEGTKYVYVRLRDQYGNVSNYLYDTIILDQTAPTNGTIAINDGQSYTPSLRSILNVSATDNYANATEMEIQHSVYNNSTYVYQDSSWENYSTAINTDFDYTKIAGGKTCRVRFRDPAGNISGWYYDSITLQVPTPKYAYKGYYTTGATRVYINPITEPTGTYTTRYYIYYSTSATADPNNGDSVTYAGSSTSTSYVYSSSIPEGQLLYFFVRAYNSDSGGWGAYSPTSVLGFSSNITVIYDDDDSADITRANAIKALLEDSTFATSDSRIYGTMPTWTVTLLPEDFVSNTYSSDYSNRIFGDPTIITSGTSFTSSSTYDGKVRNIASSGRGIVAMHYAGGYFIYRVNQNWTTWGIGGQQPNEIGYGPSMGLTATNGGKTRPYSQSEGIWHTPLYHSTLYPTYQESSIGLTLFTSNVARLGQHIPDHSVVGGYIYAGDANYPNHFPVVRQGEFLEFGYYELPNATWKYGQVFFINIIARMDNF